ncbi:MAG: hypothetical protein GYA02_09240 [Clostridiaceae bacterium]|jgi:hypothetical protein|nr:hypothetical protein [Clostridiaceae bacterium]
MLQIISGKFYNSEDRYHTPCKAPVYSNVGITNHINTTVFKIIPASYSDGEGYSYIIEYDNQLQKPTVPSGFALIKVGDKEILNQIQVICSFATNSIFSIDKNTLLKICREKGPSSTSDGVPSQYIEKTLTFRHLNNEETSFLEKFVDKLILLERDKYNAVIAALKTYNAAIKLLDDDICLAYSMLVYCIESLSQRFDGYIPKWEDYNQEIKGKIDKLVSKIDKDIGEELIRILVSDSHLKLSSRFVKFVTSNLNEEFFTVECKDIISPLQKNEIEVALKNTYSIRSGYVHELKRPTSQLLMADFSKNCDTVRIWNNTYLTFNGLLRVVRKVISSFVMKQDELKIEKYNWYNELPNQIEVPLSPELWVSKEQNVHKDNAVAYFIGFLQCYLSGKESLPDMRGVIKKFEKIYDVSNALNKTAIVALTKLYNSVIREEDRSEGYKEFIDKHSSDTEECNIINIALSLLPVSTGENEEHILWDVDLCEKEIQSYMKQRYKHNRIRFNNSIIEILMCIGLANRYKDEGNNDKFVFWMETALYNASGKYELQKQIKKAIDADEQFDISIIYSEIFGKPNDV